MRKRRNATAVGMWLGMTAAALMLGACSQSEEQLETLPEGKFPLELTAAGLQPVESPMTRATVDGNWEGVEKVAVKVGGEVKEYDVDNTTNGNTSVVLKSTDPFYWKSTAPVTVSAWWPCNADDIKTKPGVEVKTDQSAIADYQASDYIEAEEQEVTYTAPTLTFSHRTAKVCVNVVNAEGNVMAVDAVTLCLDGKADGITPYKSADGKYAALIAPTTQAEGKLSVKIVIDGATYVYTHPTAYTLAANMQYTFTLTVKRDGIQLNGCTISAWDTSAAEVTGEAKKPGYTVDENNVWHIYNAEGLKAWADEKSRNAWKKCSAVLEADIVMPAAEAGASNWTPVPSYDGVFDGNGKTISGLVIRGYTIAECGFFALIVGNNDQKGEVKNLTLKDVTIESTESYVGAVAGKFHGKIYGCQVINCNIKGKNMIGGLVGLYAPYDDDELYACSADGMVSGVYSNVGGLMGYAQCGSATGSWADCTVSLTDDEANNETNKELGGLAGSMGIFFTFSRCYWAGSGADYPVGYSGDALGYPSLGNVKVTGDWTSAITAMNTALTNKGGYSWKGAVGVSPVLEFPVNN